MAEIFRVDLDNLGFVDTDDINTLRSLGIDVQVTQRKDYDEYYIDSKNMEVAFCLNGLINLSKYFSVDLRYRTIYLGR